MFSLAPNLVRSCRPLALLFSLGLLFTGCATKPAGKYSGEWARMKGITPKGYVCQFARVPLQIDGRLDDRAWADAPWTAAFVDIEGGARPRPRFHTRAKMMWDEEYFYVAVEMEEPHVWGTLTNHDAVIFHDNDFEVFIDPDGDAHEYYEFELNALNTGWDLFLAKPYKDGVKANDAWDIPGLKTAVHVRGTLNDPRDRDIGWTLEIAFPWRVLREFARRPAPPQEGDQWRVGFSRVEWQIDTSSGAYKKVPGTKEDNWIWSAQGIIDMHRPERWGFVQFTRAAPGQTRFQPDPTLPARDVLQEIYYAQRDFRAQHKRWATTLAELGLNGAKFSPALAMNGDGYTATVVVPVAPGRTQRVHIRQDARVWVD